MQVHRDAIQPWTISVGQDVDDVEGLFCKETLHDRNRPQSHNVGASPVAYGSKPIAEEKIASDALSMTMISPTIPQ